MGYCVVDLVASVNVTSRSNQLNCTLATVEKLL